jgi:hypothetical protein
MMISIGRGLAGPGQPIGEAAPSQPRALGRTRYGIRATLAAALIGAAAFGTSMAVTATRDTAEARTGSVGKAFGGFTGAGRGAVRGARSVARPRAHRPRHSGRSVRRQVRRDFKRVNALLQKGAPFIAGGVVRNPKQYQRFQRASQNLSLGTEVLKERRNRVRSVTEQSFGSQPRPKPRPLRR